MAESKQAARATGEVKGRGSGKRLLNSIANFRFDSLTFYYVALGLYYFKSFPGSTTAYEAGWVSMLGTVTKYGVLLLLLCKLLTQRWTPKEIIVVGLLGFLTLFSYWRCGWQTLVYLYLFIVAAKGVDMRVLAEEVLVLTVLCVGAIIIFTQVGLLESTTQYVTSESRAYFWSAGNTIYLFAFRHHNYIGRYVLIACMCYTIVRYEKFKAWDLAVYAVAFWFCYFSVKSRTPAFIILLIVVLVILFKFFSLFEERIQEPLTRVVTYVLIVFSPLFSLFICTTYNSRNSFYIMLNEMLTGRISSAYTIWRDYGFSLLGQDVELVSTLTASEEGISAIVLDNAYMHMFIRFGVIIGVLLFVGYLLSAKVALDSKNYGVALIIASLVFCGISEGWFYDVGSIPLPILASLSLYGRWAQTSGKVPSTASVQNLAPSREGRGMLNRAPGYQF